MTLDWIDGRWHLDGKGIHAGDMMEIRWPDGTWEVVRIESADRGHLLSAHFEYHGLCLRVTAWPDTRFELRWPEAG
jgi:hypothetical protein